MSLRFACALVALIAALNLAAVTPARAEMVATDAAAAAVVARARVEAALERADVRAALERWGIAPDEAQSRLRGLSDVEVADLAARLDEAPAGGSTAGLIIVGILLIFFALLITDIMGYTDVFPFTRKGSAARHNDGF